MDTFADFDQRLVAEALAGDCRRDRFLGFVHADGADATTVSLLARAHPVLVSAAVAGVLAVDEAAVAAFVLTAPADHDPLQVVEVDDVAVTFALAAIEDGLAGEV